MRKIILGIVFCLLQILLLSVITNAKVLNIKNLDNILPIFPVIAEYEYAPVYLSQDIKNHPKYWRINATFNPKDESTIEIILFEKGKENRTYYCNSEKNVAKRKMQGYESILTKIDFKASESLEGLPIYGFGFRDNKGQAVLWRVMPTGNPSTRGRGINDVEGDSHLRIEYRDAIGTTIGEGSAVKIGDKTFEAQAWSEISSPPYFYAYHGSFTLGRHMGALRVGNEKWNVAEKPKKLKKGGKWILTNEKGLKRNLKIVSDHHNELVIDEVNPSNEQPSLIRIVLHITPKGYNLRSVKINNRSEKKREMHIKFEPELPIQTSDSGNFEGNFIINQGEMKNVISGTINRKQISNNSVSFEWMPSSPSWAKSKTLKTLINFKSDGYSISTRNGGKNEKF